MFKTGWAYCNLNFVRAIAVNKNTATCNTICNVKCLKLDVVRYLSNLQCSWPINRFGIDMKFSDIDTEFIGWLTHLSYVRLYHTAVLRNVIHVKLQLYIIGPHRLDSDFYM